MAGGVATRLGQAERAYTSELRDFRNTWAHQGQFSTDDTYRMLDTAERLLRRSARAEQLKIVQALKKDLQRQTVRRAGPQRATQDGGEADGG